MGQKYSISGDAGRCQCQRYAAIGYFVPAAVLPVFCQSGVSYTVHYLLFAGVFGNVSVGEGEYREQYSGDDSRGLFLRVALISCLWSFGIWHSFDSICFSMSVEAKKNPICVVVHGTVRSYQSLGVYRLCGVGIVAFGNDCRFLAKKKEYMANFGIYRIVGDVCNYQPVTDPGDPGGRRQLYQSSGGNGIFRHTFFRDFLERIPK